MNRRNSRIRIIIAAATALLLLGCGWDNTPKLVVPTPAPSAQTETAKPKPDGDTTAAAETASTEAQATPENGETPASGETPDPSATADGSAPAATVDPNLIGLWEFVRSSYKGATVSAKDTGHSVVIRFYEKNSSATVVIDNTETTGLVYALRGSTLTLTLYGETMFTFIYDGTNIIWEQEAFGDDADLYFEKVKE